MADETQLQTETLPVLPLTSGVVLPQMVVTLVLETVELEARLELVLAWAKEALAEHELSQKIRDEVSDGIEKNQREFLLRQQMQAIRKELGEDGEDDDLVEGFRTRLSEIRASLTEETATAIEREIGRFERTPAQNMDHGWIRTWLDTVLGLPWDERTDDNLDIADPR